RCHGPKKQESGLRLDSRAALLRGGAGGPVIVPGDPDRSRLLAAVRHEGDLQMPPSSKLRDHEIAALAQWIKQGAPWPGEATVRRAGPAPRRLWSLQPVRDPAPPAVRDTVWPLTTVDRFVLARLEAQGLKPVRLADKRTLLRRATFDLTGLPPTPEEIRAF